MAGWWSGSLALISDAGHMVTDAAALMIAALAGAIARRGPSPKHSYGFGRAQLVAALVNGLFMLAVVATIIIHAVSRFTSPIVVHGEAVTVVAALGLLLNIFVARMLSHGGRDLNMRAALLHVMGDLLGSLAALVSGIIVWATGWFAVDPALSLLIALLIVYSSLKLVREAFHGLMEGVPLHLSLEEIGKTMAGVEGVISVHDLHVWSLTAERIALSAHVMIRGLESWPETLIRLKALLAQRYGIEHVTLQPEIGEQTPAAVSAPRVVSLTENFTAQRPAQRRDR
jgi:cobalt-zinc-cadmium efflux system protein